MFVTSSTQPCAEERPSNDAEHGLRADELPAWVTGTITYPIARLAAAWVLTLRYYGLLDGHIRCLGDKPEAA